MNIDKKTLRLYAVTDRTWLDGRTLYDDVEKALKGGVTLLQLREKNMSTDDFINSAKEIKSLCEKYNVPLIINDNVDVAKAVNADGVHIGQNDMPAHEARKILGKNKIIGVTAKTVEQAQKAEKDGADYLGSGAIFGTTTKGDAKKMDMQTLKSITSSVNIPVVAIGGIDGDNVLQLKGTGIVGAAVVSGIFAQDDIETATKDLYNKIGEDNMKTALTIAGSDSSGGAGIQADLKSFAANGVFGMSVINSVTSQNTTGVFGVYDIPCDVVASQIDAVFEDIFPDAVKIGMVSSAEIINTIADRLKYYNAKNIVLDTIMVSTSGCKLLRDDAIDALTSVLFPIADIITPNLHEAQILCGFDIRSESDMVRAADVIYNKYNVTVLLKGGHLANTSNDLLYDGNETWFEAVRIDNPNTHGTGCTLSSAIAANLAKGMDMKTAVKSAKDYITGALSDMLDLGKGSGPLNHMYKFYPNKK